MRNTPHLELYCCLPRFDVACAFDMLAMILVQCGIEPCALIQAWPSPRTKTLLLPSSQPCAMSGSGPAPATPPPGWPPSLQRPPSGGGGGGGAPAAAAPQSERSKLAVMLRIKTSVEAGRMEGVEDDIRTLDPDLLDRSPQVTSSIASSSKTVRLRVV